MSGYGPLSWSYGFSVLRSIAEPTWLYYRDATGALQRYQDNTQMVRPPVTAYIGWAILRIVLCIDMTLISELVGVFVLRSVDYDGTDFRTHRSNAYAVAFISCIGGAIASIIVFLMDAVYSTPESRSRLSLADPDNVGANSGYPLDASQMGVANQAKNYTEGGAITLKKLRIHAVMRCLLWPIVGIIAGATGVTIWHATKLGNSRNLTAKVITGIVVQLTGVAVIVVGPSIIQLLSLMAQKHEPLPRR